MLGVAIKKEERERRESRFTVKDEVFNSGHDSESSSDAQERRHHRAPSPDTEPAGLSVEAWRKRRDRGTKPVFGHGPIGAAASEQTVRGRGTAFRQGIQLRSEQPGVNLRGAVGASSSFPSRSPIGSALNGTCASEEPGRRRYDSGPQARSASAAPMAQDSRKPQVRQWTPSSGPVGAVPGVFQQLNMHSWKSPKGTARAKHSAPVGKSSGKHQLRASLQSNKHAAIVDGRSLKRKVAEVVDERPPIGTKSIAASKADDSSKRAPLKNPSSLLKSSARMSPRSSTKSPKFGGKGSNGPVGLALDALSSLGKQRARMPLGGIELQKRIPLGAMELQKRKRVVLRPRLDKRNVWRKVVMRELHGPRGAY